MRAIIKLILVLSMAGCTQNVMEPVDQNNQSIVENKEAEQLLEVVPHQLHGFVYTTTQTYPEPWGYSFRFIHESNPRIHADIYVYPVPENLNLIDSKRIVLEMASQSLQEIDEAAKQGSYSDYQLIRNSSIEINGHFVTRSDIYLIRSNLAVYSLLFLTESKGTLIKARISMPDNETNRSGSQWEEFVREMFSAILIHIRHS